MMVDVYSYAMLVWHIFTRQLPYGGRRMVLNEITKLLDEVTVSAESSVWAVPTIFVCPFIHPCIHPFFLYHLPPFRDLKFPKTHLSSGAN